jgi:REP element-mobilizing transposase RayT
MARPLRINVTGAWAHVTARGNERERIFRGDRDDARLMKIIEEMAGIFLVEI